MEGMWTEKNKSVFEKWTSLERLSLLLQDHVEGGWVRPRFGLESFHNFLGHKSFIASVSRYMNAEIIATQLCIFQLPNGNLAAMSWRNNATGNVMPTKKKNKLWEFGILSETFNFLHNKDAHQGDFPWITSSTNQLFLSCGAHGDAEDFLMPCSNECLINIPLLILNWL